MVHETQPGDRPSDEQTDGRRRISNIVALAPLIVYGILKMVSVIEFLYEILSSSSE